MSALAEDYYVDDGLTLQALFAAVAARRWWVLSTVVLVAAAFAAYAFLATPIYRATTVLAPARPARTEGVSSQVSGLATVAGLEIASRNSETEEALAVLRSREFTENFISANNLMPQLFQKKWNLSTGTWKVDDQHRPTLGKAYRLFDKKIRSVVQDKKTGLVTVNIDWRDRRAAAFWANDLVQRLNAEMRARAITKAEASVRFLEKELQTTSAVEVRNAISRLLETEVKQRMLADVTPEYSFSVVDRALPADEDDPVSPKRLALLIAGPFVGFGIGTIGAVISNRRRSETAQTLVPNQA
jgi:uncharacterized protein involved in exopolysaccharide biosynthesis